MVKQDIYLKSINADSLERRIAANKASESIDFNKWVFNRLEIKSDFHILELCCGTGSQTLEFLKRIDAKGHIFGVDISNDAIQKLKTNLIQKQDAPVTLINSDIDNFETELSSRKIPSHSFDLIFCSYGLYYSNDVEKLLNTARKWLKPKGAIVIVGPFGPNNAPLFEILKSSGLSIPDFVTYTSRDFMYSAVIPWAATHFNSTNIFTMVNNIRWATPHNVMTYWKNSTFFDPTYETAVNKKIQDQFDKTLEFVNHKWVMMVVMTNEKNE